MLASARLFVRTIPAARNSLALRSLSMGEVKVENKRLLDPNLPYKNAALAAALLSAVGGIMYYSMHAVGQAGTEDGEDPLMAALEKEAQEAKSKEASEKEATETTQDMLAKFQSGEYDPDLQEQRELEAELEKQAKKKPWWKVW